MGPSWAPTPKHGQASPGGPGQAGPGTPVPSQRGTAGRGRAKRGRAGAAGPGATGPNAAGPSAAGARIGRGPAQACPAMDSPWLAQPHGQRGRSLKGETTCPRDDGYTHTHDRRHWTHHTQHGTDDTRHIPPDRRQRPRCVPICFPMHGASLDHRSLTPVRLVGAIFHRAALRSGLVVPSEKVRLGPRVRWTVCPYPRASAS